MLQGEDRNKESLTPEGANGSRSLQLGDGYAMAPHKNALVDKATAGWVPTEVAAAVLRVAPDVVRDHLRAGRLVANAQGNENNRTWLVSVDSMQKMLANSRQTTTSTISAVRENVVEKKSVLEDDGGAIRELIDRLEARTVEAACVRAQLEQVKHSESILKEEREQLIGELTLERREHERLARELETKCEDHEQLTRELESEREKRKRLANELETKCEEHEQLTRELESEREERRQAREMFLDLEQKRARDEQEAQKLATKNEAEPSKRFWGRLFGGLLSL